MAEFDENALWEELLRQQQNAPQQPTREQVPEPQQELLRQLVSSNVDRGLSYDPQKGLGYTGGVSGYDGPLRPSDVPGNVRDVINMTGMKQTQYADAIAEQEQRKQMLGQANVGELSDLIKSLHGASPDVLRAIIANKTGFRLPNPQDQSASTAQALALFRHNLGEADRKLNRDALAEQRDATNAMREEDLRRKAQEEIQRMVKAKRPPEEIAQAIQTLGYALGAPTPGGLLPTWLGGTPDMPTLGERLPARGKTNEVPAESGKPMSLKETAQALARARGMDPEKLTPQQITAFVKAAQSGVTVDQVKPLANVFQPVERPQPKTPPNPEVEAAKAEKAKEAAKAQDEAKKQEVKGQKEMQQRMKEISKKLIEQSKLKHDEEVLRIRRQLGNL